MKKYEKPMVLAAEELAEGVYAASGASDCYTVTQVNMQTPQEGRRDYRFQVDGRHDAADGHHSGEQNLHVSFNMPVKLLQTNGTLVSGDGTSTLVIKFNYHNNAGDNIGTGGDVIVDADPGLAITEIYFDCNHDCFQH